MGDVSHQKSVFGIVVKLAGGVVLYQTAYQQTIAHSSTKSKFIAACEARKYILYLQSLLEEIELPQEAAAVLYEVRCSFHGKCTENYSKHSPS